MTRKRAERQRQRRRKNRTNENKEHLWRIWNFKADPRRVQKISWPLLVWIAGKKITALPLKRNLTRGNWKKFNSKLTVLLNLLALCQKPAAQINPRLAINCRVLFRVLLICVLTPCCRCFSSRWFLLFSVLQTRPLGVHLKPSTRCNKSYSDISVSISLDRSIGNERTNSWNWSFRGHSLHMVFIVVFLFVQFLCNAISCAILSVS